MEAGKDIGKKAIQRNHNNRCQYKGAHKDTRARIGMEYFKNTRMPEQELSKDNYGRNLQDAISTDVLSDEIQFVKPPIVNNGFRRYFLSEIQYSPLIQGQIDLH